MLPTNLVLGFSGGSVAKNLPSKAGDAGLILESGRSPGVGNGNPLQDSCLEYLMAYRVKKSSTQLND